MTTNPAAALAYEIYTEWPTLTGTEAASEAILQRLTAAGWKVVRVNNPDGIEAAARAMAWNYLDNGFYNLPDGTLNPDPECEAFRQMKIARETPRFMPMAKLAVGTWLAAAPGGE